MAYIKEKTLNGRKYRYLTRSLRLPDGRIKTIQKLVKEDQSPAELEKKYFDFFMGREKKAYAEYALKRFKADALFTGEQMEKLEGIRVDYAYTLKKFGREQLKDVFDRFTANFTYESNAIEGSSLTLKDVSMVLFEDRTIEGKDLREIYEARNSREVVDCLLQRRFRMREEDILRIHAMIMKDIDSRTGYKRIPNFIVGSSVKLTPPEEVEHEMEELMDWYHQSAETLHPLKVSALFHGRFEKIHPFEDGNGRVGRILSNLILIQNRYPPLIIRKTQRGSYIKSLEDFHRGYTTNLERLFVDKYKKTYNDFFAVYLKYIKP
jgi:Fic family protein